MEMEAVLAEDDCDALGDVFNPSVVLLLLLMELVEIPLVLCSRIEVLDVSKTFAPHLS